MIGCDMQESSGPQLSSASTNSTSTTAATSFSRQWCCRQQYKEFSCRLSFTHSLHLGVMSNPLIILTIIEPNKCGFYIGTQRRTHQILLQISRFQPKFGLVSILRITSRRRGLRRRIFSTTSTIRNALSRRSSAIQRDKMTWFHIQALVRVRTVHIRPTADNEIGLCTVLQGFGSRDHPGSVFKGFALGLEFFLVRSYTINPIIYTPPQRLRCWWRWNDNQNATAAHGSFHTTVTP